MITRTLPTRRAAIYVGVSKADRGRRPGRCDGARAQALAELDRRMSEDPTLDPNWTFSDIMQELLEEYLRHQK